MGITDEPMISPTSLMSSIGGILNFWAGITVVLIVEVLEFFIQIMVSSQRPHREVTSANIIDDSAKAGGNESVEQKDLRV